MSAIAGYRQRPDEMTAAAASIGCQLWVPHIGRDFTWEPDPGVIVVTNNATETRWWQALAWPCEAMCLIRGRLQWKSTLQGQTAFYFGDDKAAFRAAFKAFGNVKGEFTEDTGRAV